MLLRMAWLCRLVRHGILVAMYCTIGECKLIDFGSWMDISLKDTGKCSVSPLVTFDPQMRPAAEALLPWHIIKKPIIIGGRPH
jgi:hypothetical protein